jgi:hypothetical protein
MSPEDYYQMYKNLSPIARLPNGDFASFSGLRVVRYVINSVDKDTHLPPPGSHLEAIYTNIDSVLVAARRFRNEWLKRTGVEYPDINETAFARVKVGKGSPWEMKHILEVGLACGKLAADKDQLLNYVREYFGVDCTGFVSAFFRDTGMALNATGNSRDNPMNAGCRYFYDNAKTKSGILWNFDDIRQRDVLVWMTEDGSETRKPGHISLIHDKGGSNNLFCRESNGASGEDPRQTTRVLGAVEGAEGHRYWVLDPDGSKEKVLVLRPFN